MYEVKLNNVVSFVADTPLDLCTSAAFINALESGRLKIKDSTNPAQEIISYPEIKNWIAQITEDEIAYLEHPSRKNKIPVNFDFEALKSHLRTSEYYAKVFVGGMKELNRKKNESIFIAMDNLITASVYIPVIKARK